MDELIWAGQGLAGLQNETAADLHYWAMSVRTCRGPGGKGEHKAAVGPFDISECSWRCAELLQRVTEAFSLFLP